MSNDESFLERWSRLKRTQVEPANPGAAPPLAGSQHTTNAGTGGQTAAAGDDTETAEPLDLEKLPKLEDLTADSDIRGFLDKRVPAALRNAALRQMWSLDPTIRDFIEVAENQWNWNVPGGAPFYGPLEPGTDVAALLAQATGALQSVAKATDASTAHGDVIEPASGRAGSIPQRAGDGGPDAAVQPDIAVAASTPEPSALPGIEVGVENPSFSASDRLSTEDAAVQSITAPNGHHGSEETRRRHGGAMPG